MNAGRVFVLLGGLFVVFLLYEAGLKPELMGLLAIMLTGLVLVNWQTIVDQFRQIGGSASPASSGSKTQGGGAPTGAPRPL